MNRRLACAALLFTASITLAGCSSETSGVPNLAQLGRYVQIDRVGRPGVKELFESFSDHDTTNRNAPYNDPTLSAAITNFMTGTAGRPGAASAVATVFALDGLQANLSQSGQAGYLGIETSGATGTAFGGRALTDDAMSTDLAAAYGTLISSQGTTQPCMSTDNEPGSRTAEGYTSSAAIASADHETATFPYLGAPH